MAARLMVILLGLALFSCQTTREGNTSYTEGEQFYKDQFKLFFVKRCVKYGFKENKSVEELLAQECSSARDFPLGLAGYRHADSLAKKIAVKIENDSINRASQPNPDSTIIGRRVFLYCLEYYDSLELDSIIDNRLGKKIKY